MIRAECPKCNKWAEGEICVEALFGFRKVYQRYIHQSWCRQCRETQKIKEETRFKKRVIIEKSKREEERAVISKVYEDDINAWTKELLEFSPIQRVVKYRQKYIKPKKIPIIDTKPKLIKLDLLEGLTDGQQTVVKRLVDKGCSPMGFDVLVDTDEIYYFGRLVA